MKNLRYLDRLFALVLFASFGLSAVTAQNSDKGTPDKDASLHKVSGNPQYQVFDINNIDGWERSDGRIWGSPNGEPSTLFPKGTVSTIYGGGIVWLGKAYLNAAHTVPAPLQVVRQGGHVRGSSSQAGRVIGSGATATPEGWSN